MTISSQATALSEHHKAIEALDTFEAITAYAARVNSSGYDAHITDELLHHLERRRGELLRKMGALVG